MAEQEFNSESEEYQILNTLLENFPVDLWDHLGEEVETELGDLVDLHKIVHRLMGKSYRREKRIQQHVHTCSTCLSSLLKDGQLRELKDVWQEDPPKLHRMVN